MSTSIRIVIASLLISITAFPQDKTLDKWHKGGKGVVKHLYYDVCFDSEHKVPKWVMYRMTDRNKKHVSDREGRRFVVDAKIKDTVSQKDNYSRSGYDCGHMVPADDMEFSDSALQETFYTSNISPQSPGFNRGIWKELENQVRTWLKEGREMVVVAGTIFNDDESTKTIGKDKVGIPDGFYKIVYDYKNKEMAAFLFMFNDDTHNDECLGAFIVTVEEIERRTGIDFFKGIDGEASLESTIGFELHK